ncbi:unnamed protein product [Rotaria sp. Silwood2]|nr:unnamed protein product [Rotaria sp. Silwood2]CAF2980540.1 unnamed protein product [Rotaria sp. Silwood2]CAF3225535.1 unnamed protein product [Rotaria sp. Silwood2]CAF3345014.1 unnamed protein product [Rotaria sp. Silwood2]CAF4151599.1 unnamed protein product [Rotaria sp. Silwood2]
MSNWYIDDYITDASIITAHPTVSPRSYANDTCVCGYSSTCSSPAFIDGWLVPGFRVGCNPIQSLLQSTLECLYNVTCIDKIKPNDSTSHVIFRALDSTRSTSTILVQSLVDDLMVDRWETNVVYEYYYKACGPLYCIYSLDLRFDKVYVLTTIISLSGGLTVTLKLVLPLAVKIGRYIAMYRRRLLVRSTVTIIA